MPSNILSKFLPPTTGEPSIYETLRQTDGDSDQSDIVERAGMAIDEENLDTRFNDYELDDALADVARSQTVPSRIRERSNHSQRRQDSDNIIRNQAPQSRKTVDDMDDEVPQSLLIEDEMHHTSNLPARTEQLMPPPVPGPSSRGTQARWQATQEQQRLHQEAPVLQGRLRMKHRRENPTTMMTPKERALWMWANVENLDNFLQDVYDYFIGNGIWSICLNRILNLLYVQPLMLENRLILTDE